ncbi:MAG: beta-hydroxyacyl-ACP dehydratase [Planctomycetes bacterium]|nr:beta-hydroxyacyl-ACP dehydratase [Planctomycetota bacterium]
MNTSDILAAIPHRPPFLLIDEVVEISADRAVTLKRVDPESGFFDGHFPGHPVMPGVLVCECAFQTGALLVAHRTGDGSSGAGIPLLTRIQDARFKRQVQPGQVLRVEVVLDDELGGAYFMTGRVTSDEKAVLRVQFACTLVPAEASGR